MEKGRVVLLELKDRPDGVVQHWMMGIVVDDDESTFLSLKRCLNIYELTDPQGKFNHLTQLSHLSAEGDLNVESDSFRKWRYVGPDEEAFKTYTKAFQEYDGRKAGLIMNPHNTGRINSAPGMV